MEEMVTSFLPFFIFVSYLCKSIDDYNPLKRKSDYEKNDANADIAIKNVKIQPTLNVV